MSVNQGSASVKQTDCAYFLFHMLQTQKQSPKKQNEQRQIIFYCYYI